MTADAVSSTYRADEPTILSVDRDAPLSIKAVPDRALYRRGKLPRISIHASAVPRAHVHYSLTDGFGEILSERNVPVGDAVTVDVGLPPGRGYYEIVVRLVQDGEAIYEMRRSIGALAPPAPAVGDEPFGLWIQGEEFYPELGVRWARDGITWGSHRNSGERYFANRIALYDWFREHGIRTVVYPKGLPRPYQTSREVIEDTPEAWAALEDWWTTIVKRFAGHVDAWAVANEPMSGHWKGDNDLILRYWALMRRIVDRFDPKTPLIGPSLNPNWKKLRDQYRDLLAAGFADSIDAVEMHTYINRPTSGTWARNDRHIRDMTRAAKGRELAVWSTEHGYSAKQGGELRQARLLMLSWLEAKRLGYPVMIWHMFSYPQGSDRREVQFSIFRNFRAKHSPPPQPRPAAVAYGVMTRQLSGAVFRAEARDLGPSVNGYVFERNSRQMLALWTTDGKSRRVALPAAGAMEVSVTDLFGRTETEAVVQGSVRVTVGPNPVFVVPLLGDSQKR